MTITKRLTGALRFGGLALAATFVAFSLSTSAFAATVNASGQAGAQAGAGAAAVVNQTGSGAMQYGGQYTVHNTPDVVAPSIYSMNKCSGGVSGGASIAGFGISFGTTRSITECNLQNWYVLAMRTAAATHNPVYIRWAVGMACAANKTVRAVAPPGVCSSVKPVAVSADVSSAPPVKTVARITSAKPAMVLAKVRIPPSEAKGALAYCAFPSLVWSAYPACYHKENVLAGSLSSGSAVPSS